MADKIGGIPQSNLPEALLDIPATAHILGGAVIAAGPERGVVDMQQRAFGYHNLLVCDGSVVPANPGVNPSLTITALAEHAMSFIPPAGEDTAKPQRALDATKDDVEVKDRPTGESAQHEAGEPAEPQSA